jgi:hypothetical protein
MFKKTSDRPSSAVSGLIRSSLIVILLAIATLAGNVARAQLAGTGAIAGTVQDPTGAFVANATVTATNAATNVATTRTATTAGDYNITPLVPGNYTVTVAASGFEGYKQENITVNALETVTLNVKMTIGQANETVTITAAPPLLNTSDASLGATMDNQMYSNLPLLMGYGGNADQRRATDFEYLMPGVQGNYNNGNATSNSGIVNGSGPKGGVSDIYIDGVDMPEADGVGDPRFTWTAIGVDSIDQFQVQTAGFSAQYAGQGVQNYTVKSGGNAYHGSLYEYIRNTIFDAWNFTNKAPQLTGQPVPAGGVCTSAALTASTNWCALGGIKPREIMNEFGIVVSGPIIKNKLFLFGNYGQYRNQNGARYQSLTVPTLNMLGLNAAGQSLGYADFRGYATANGAAHIYDPATQTPSCSNCTRQPMEGLINGVPTADIIPASRISQAASYYNQFLMPYEGLANQSSYTNNLSYGTATGLANWYSTGRIDYDQSSRDQISFIVAFGRQAATGLNSGSGLLPPFNTSQIYNPVTTVDIIKDVFTINSHLVNQFSLGYGRYQSDSVTPNWQSQYAATTAGILNMPPGQAAGGFPKITWSGTYSNPMGDNSSNNTGGKYQWGGYAFNNKINNTYTTTDNLQWVHGKHTFTFGGQYSDLQFDYASVVSASGPMAFGFSATETAAFTSGKSTSSTTGSSVASYMLGAVDSSSATVDAPVLGTRWRDPSFWAEDDYKVNDNLTLNLGLRWDIFPSIQEAHNIFSFLNPNGTNSITGNAGTLAFAGSGNSALYCNCSNPAPTVYTNIAPRIGFSYAVSPKTVVRGSYDVAYARGDWTSGSQSGSPSTLGFTPSASAPGGTSAAPAFYWDNTPCATTMPTSSGLPAAGTGSFANDGVTCGWTGSVVQPVAPAGGTSLAEYVTANTVALGKAGTSVTYFDSHYGAKTPQYINWTFGIQREITRDMSLTLSYVGSQGHFIAGGQSSPLNTNHLPLSYAGMAGYNLNGSNTSLCGPSTCGFGTGNTDLLTSNSTATALTAAAAAGFTPMNPYTGAAVYYASNSVYQYYLHYPQFSGVSDTTNFTGNTAFHALEVTLRQRNAHGLDFMMNYTYSKSIDDLGTFRTYDPAYARLDRSLSATDLPQNLTVTAVYSSPVGKGALGGTNFVVRELAKDWNLSGIFSYHSGSPIAVTGSGCPTNGLLNQCMPNVVPGVAARQGSYGKNVVADPSATNYIGKVSFLNGAAFSVNQAGTLAQVGTQAGSAATGLINYVGNGPALYVPGNAARIGADNVWGMGFYDLDMGLKRLFPLYEGFSLQFEADMTNVTNHVAWGAVNGGVTGSSFGTVTALATNYSPRDVQFAARLIF